MLLRLITIISLMNFLLLMISGAPIQASLHRSVMVFLVLFTIVYVAMVLANMVGQTPAPENSGGSSEIKRTRKNPEK